MILWLVRSILKKFLYGRVGGVSRGEYAYPGIQITGRLCYFFWKLPIFSFRQLLIFLFCYTHFTIKFHIHTFFWMDTSSTDYWHFQTLCAWISHCFVIWLNFFLLFRKNETKNNCFLVFLFLGGKTLIFFSNVHIFLLTFGKYLLQMPTFAFWKKCIFSRNNINIHFCLSLFFLL